MGWEVALACYGYAAREKGNFAHCGERRGLCQTNYVGLHHPLERCGQGQLRWPGNFDLPTAR